MDAKDLAYNDYLEGMKYKDIADKYGVSINTVKSWQKRNGWSRKGCTQKTKKGAHKNKGGAPKGNQNAKGNKGGSAPKGNVNSVKHGAYQMIYADFLQPEERELYELMPGEADLEEEIRLLRLKLARLLSREHDFFYDMFGNRREKDISEEDRQNGILACTEQLAKLVKVQNQVQRTALDEEEQQVRIEKLRAETKRINEEKDTGSGSVVFAGEGDLID